MRIGVVADPQSFHTEKWCYGLQERGAEVVLFSFSAHTLPGIPCIQVPASFKRGRDLSYASFLFGGKALANAVHKHKLDVLNPINVTPYGVWAARAKTGLPLVNVSMGADILEYPPAYGDAIAAERRWNQNERIGWKEQMVGRIKWQAFRYFVSRSLRASSLVTGDNLQLTHAVRDWFGIPQGKTFLHRWGIEEALFERDEQIIEGLRQRFGLSKNKPLLLSIRGLKPVYQADIILEGLEKMLEQNPEAWQVMILGAGYSPTVALDRKARELADRFSHLTYVPERLSRAETHQLWHLADAFINAPAYDGFSNGLNEGRYAGAIPILNDIAAHREIALPDKHAIFVTPFIPEKLAQVLIELPVKLSELKGRFAAENRSWTLENALFKTEMSRFLEYLQDEILTSERRTGFEKIS